MEKMRNKNVISSIRRFGALTLMLCMLFSLVSCINTAGNNPSSATESQSVGNGANKDASGTLDLDSIPPYSGEPYVVLYDNIPRFTSSEKKATSFETYGDLDSLGRCTTVYACVGRDLMPEGERGSIGSVKPSGWQTVKYDIVDGKYLYNRCHLIGWQLTGENANEQNLITGTRYLNIKGMLPFENMIADYVKETNNHVLYRVTPIFTGNNLVANGVLMEAYSVEDNGEGICFCVYAYNVQPGIVIDYANGNSALDGTPLPENTTAQSTSAEHQTYVLNTNTKKFHYPTCASAQSISEQNRQTYTGARDELIADGYSSCGNCRP